MPHLTLALVQIPLIWQDPKANRELLDFKLDDFFKASEQTIDVVVLPETFTTGFTMTPESVDKAEGERTLAWMLDKAQTYQSAICGSVVYWENNQFYNRFLFANPDGTHAHYDKNHTYTLAGESKAYQKGKEIVTSPYKDFIIRPLICYDLRFPAWSRNHQNYDLLLYVANWPKPRINAWDTLLQARAIENQSYSIGVNRIGNDPNNLEYPGHTSAYDPLGKTLCKSQEEEIVTVTLSKKLIRETREKLPFLDDKDEFVIREM